MQTEETRIPLFGPVWATESRHAIVDLGADVECPRRAETLVALGLPKRRNFAPWIQGRLIARVPLADLPALIAAGAPIAKGATYYKTTHHWLGLGAGEELVPASCDAYDRTEAEARDDERAKVGSRIFTTWKWIDRSYTALSKHLGGIRRYGVSVPIPIAEVARVYGIGSELTRFADACPHWQRPDILRILRQVAVEAAERAAPLRAGCPQRDVADAVIALARAAGTKTDIRNPTARSKEVDAMWRADPASLAAYHAQSSAIALANRWMKTGIYDRGEEMIWPARSVCGQAVRAAGMAALIGMDLPPLASERAYALCDWEDQVRKLQPCREAEEAERRIQVERLVELSGYPAPTAH